MKLTGHVHVQGPIPKGARQANLTDRTRKFMQEVALNEQASPTKEALTRC